MRGFWTKKNSSRRGLLPAISNFSKRCIPAGRRPTSHTREQANKGSALPMYKAERTLVEEFLGCQKVCLNQRHSRVRLCKCNSHGHNRTKGACLLLRRCTNNRTASGTYHPVEHVLQTGRAIKGCDNTFSVHRLRVGLSAVAQGCVEGGDSVKYELLGHLVVANI